MKNFNLCAIILASSLVFSTGVMAETMSSELFTSQKKIIETEYKSEMAKCYLFAKDVNKACVTEAKNKKYVANAELKFNYKPSAKSRFGLRIAKTNADYSVATEKCNDRVGNAKADCTKKARAVKTYQITDAKIKAKTIQANVETNDESTAAHTTAKAGSVYSEPGSFKSKVIPAGKDIFKNQNMPIAM